MATSAVSLSFLLMLLKTLTLKIKLDNVVLRKKEPNIIKIDFRELVNWKVPGLPVMLILQQPLQNTEEHWKRGDCRHPN